MTEGKYNEMTERALVGYKFYWEKFEQCDYLIGIYGEKEDLVIGYESSRLVLSELGELLKIAGIVIDTKWYEEKRAEIRKRVDDNAEHYKEQFGE